MASSKLPLAAILFFLVAAAATASAPAPATPDAVCRTVKYPALCRKLIETYHPASTHALMEAAFQETIKRLNLGRIKCGMMSRLFSKNDTAAAMNIQSCGNSYGDYADELRGSVFAKIKGGDAKDVTFAASTVSSIVSSCYDLFDVNNDFGGEMEFPSSHIYKNLVKHATNLMTVACAAYPGVCK